MKKTYIQPDLMVVEMNLKQILMTSVDMNDSGGSVQMQGDLNTEESYEIF